ncbi:uncharacterized protein ARMOST_00565 [Armillaria ostoyae]|uniref:Uncharacterized protein n=1 Tax=Armillaria ostoyae TaxID=47428 RepID=A0A284QLH6_ARMOS|nr:uncharacterized protein ARMOST_00565 [Armillaria ostoyae]
MPRIFTQCNVDEQKRIETKQSRDDAWITNKNKLKHMVELFVWRMDQEGPVSIEVQDGYEYPEFEISPTILKRIRLPDDEYLYWFRPGILRRWVEIEVHHVINVKEHGMTIFLKAARIDKCQDFDIFLPLLEKTTAMHAQPSFRSTISTQRQAIKVRHDQEILATALPSRHAAISIPKPRHPPVIKQEPPSPILSHHAKRPRQSSLHSIPPRPMLLPKKNPSSEEGRFTASPSPDPSLIHADVKCEPRSSSFSPPPVSSLM